MYRFCSSNKLSAFFCVIEAIKAHDARYEKVFVKQKLITNETDSAKSKLIVSG